MNLSRHQTYRRYLQSDEQKEKEKKRHKDFYQEHTDKKLERMKCEKERQQRKRTFLNLPENKQKKEIQLEKDRIRKQTKRESLPKRKRKAVTKHGRERKRIKRSQRPKAKLQRIDWLLMNIAWNDILGYANKNHLDQFVLQTESLPQRLNSEKTHLLEYLNLHRDNNFKLIQHHAQLYKNTKVVVETAIIDQTPCWIPSETDDIPRESFHRENEEFVQGMEAYLGAKEMIVLVEDGVIYHLDKKIRRTSNPSWKYVGYKVKPRNGNRVLPKYISFLSVL